MLKLRKNKKGFTLVELMVVVVIIGILTAIAIPVYMSVTANAEKAACQANQRTIDSAIMVYKAENNGNLPTNVAALSPTYIALMPVCKKGCVYGFNATGICKITNADAAIKTAHELHAGS